MQHRERYVLNGSTVSGAVVHGDDKEESACRIRTRATGVPAGARSARKRRRRVSDSKPGSSLHTAIFDQNRSNIMANPCYAILWLIVLFIAWPVAFAASALWIMLQPFEACFGCIRDANNCLEGFITWPRKCGDSIFRCSSSCPQP